MSKLGQIHTRNQNEQGNQTQQGNQNELCENLLSLNYCSNVFGYNIWESNIRSKSLLFHESVPQLPKAVQN